MDRIFKIALCQMKVTADKNENIKKACDIIMKAADAGASIAVLPEMFNCPYSNSCFGDYAESIENGATIASMRSLARKLGIYIAAGSIPETDGGRLYNTCVLIDRNGEVLCRHRKVHLFDIDVPGGVTFKESDTLSPGSSITIADTDLCRVGIVICYDMRFPELIRLMALDGIKLCIVPAAFNMTTGPAHWEPLIRVRAIDNQIFMAAVSPARDEGSSYTAYGHSMAVDPWGGIIAEAGADEEVVIADMNLAEVDMVRDRLPLLRHRRTDLYGIFNTHF